MRRHPWIGKCIVAAWLTGTSTIGPAWALDNARLDDLFDQLAGAEDAAAAETIEGAIFTEWSKSGSAPIDLLLSRGQEALQAGEPELAAEHFTAAIDHAPDFAEAYHGRANAYYLTGRIGPAIADLRQTLALNPRHFAAMRGFAVILEELGQPENALDVYRQVLMIDPFDATSDEAVTRLSHELEGQIL